MAGDEAGLGARQRKSPTPQQRHHRPEQRSGGTGTGMEAGRQPKKMLHVVYFLSRDGRVEQPHLIRVVRSRRHRRDGVRLRDVKRWLSELRGEGMPDSFAWSCKKRYKAGHVWEDLADDDLITPLSDDDEYVLKGSLVTLTTGIGVAAARAATGTMTTSASSSSSSPTLSSPAAAAAGAGAGECLAVAAGDPKSPRPPLMPAAVPENPDRQDALSPKAPLPLDDDDEEGEELGEEQRGSFEHLHLCSDPPAKTASRRAAQFDGAVSDNGSGEITEDAVHGGEGEGKKGAATSSPSYGQSPGKRRSSARDGNAGRGGRKALVFGSLLRCGAVAVQTDDSALKQVSPSSEGELRGDKGGDGRGVPPDRWHTPRDPLEEGGARNSRRGRGSRPANRKGEAAGERRKKTVRAGEYEPAAEPNCSQCGRAFRPERLHSHMKSCRGLKSQRKAKSSGKLPQQPHSRRAMTSEEAATLFLLTH